MVYRREGAIHRVTYGQLESLVDLAAGQFRSGESVGIAMPMTLEAVVAYLAAIRSGATVVSIAESFAPGEIARRLAIGGATRVVTQDVVCRGGKVLPMYERVVQAGAGSVVVVRTVEGGDMAVRDRDADWSRLLGEKPASPVPVPGDTHSNVLFSSGTTGEPKAIPWTHLTPIKAAMDGHFHQDIGPGDVVCWPTSLGWMMGPWLVYASLINGATLALFDDAPTDPGFGNFVRDAGVTMLGVVPSLVAAWRESGGMEGKDWSRIRRFSSTGEASNVSDARYLSGLAGGKPIVDYCGGTEIGGAYVTGTLVQPSLPAAFTTPALGIDFDIMDATGAPSDEGEAFLRPPSVGLSRELINGDHDTEYFAGTPGPGLRRHGDQMARAADGSYRALGRADDTMNLGGIKVSSAELERAVLAVEGAREVAAVSTPGDSGTERLSLFIVAAAGSNRDTGDWKRLAQETISKTLNPLFKVEDVRVVDSLPRTASNKVRRRDLRRGLIAND